MPATLILHIGSEKTGSKSIQHAMRRSARFLYSQYRILYPRRSPLFLRNAHYPIVSPFIAAAELDFVATDKRLTDRQLHDALVALRERSKADTIVLSAEHLSSRLRPPGIAALRETLASALPDHRILILYNVRSQTTQYCAAMSTHLKTFGINPKPALDVSSSSAANRFLNHFQVASDWSDIFGAKNLVIRNYHSNDAVFLFYDVLGVDSTDKRLYRPTKRNTSLSHEQARILNVVNAAFGEPNFENEALIKLRRHVQGSLIYHLSSVLTSRTPLISILTREDRMHFQHEFSDSNRQLTTRFGLDFDLNDYMEIEIASASSDLENTDFAAELAYWRTQIGQGPLSTQDAMRVARRLRTLLIGKHIRRLLSERGRALEMSRELAGRI